MLARGATLGPRWVHEPQTISNRTLGLGSPHHAGGIDPVYLRLSARVFEVM